MAVSSPSRSRRFHVQRQHVALALSATALFIAVGGPAYAANAAKAISGTTIKAKSITSKQLADRSVTFVKLSAAARSALHGKAGPTGATGAGGAAGG